MEDDAELEDRVQRLEALARAVEGEVVRSDEVRASAFYLMGPGGVRASLDTSEQGAVAFRQNDAQGRTRLLLTIQADQTPSLVLTDASGQTRLVVQVGADGCPLIRLRDAAGTPRLEALVTADGQPQLTLFDAERRPRLVAAVASDGKPVLVKLGEDGLAAE